MYCVTLMTGCFIRTGHQGSYYCFALCNVLGKYGYKKVNRKVQGMPQSQTAANPRHQEEEKKDKNIHAQH